MYVHGELTLDLKPKDKITLNVNSAQPSKIFHAKLEITEHNLHTVCKVF